MPGGVLSCHDDGVIMHLGSLNDEEIISLVRTRDELIVTDLEKELADRLARALDADETNEKIQELENELEALEEENTRLEQERDEADRRAADLEDHINERKDA